jgi:putative DNA-invertase from lambdoid prophage Rac
MATILYARVSTVEQTIDHQLAQAKAAGFVIDETVADNGVSGVATRLIERPEGKRLFDKLRAGDVPVVRWVDRLGRNYEDVCDAIREFMRRGVVIRTVINNFTFGGATKDPMQQAVRDALIGFMAATAQAVAGGEGPYRRRRHIFGIGRALFGAQVDGFRTIDRRL